MPSIILGQSVFLALALLAPLLIFAYRKKLKGKDAYVSSLFLIKKLKHIPRSKRKIELPFRFYVELLCLLLLLLAVSMPQIKEEKRHIIFLIDNSLSMRAASGQGLRFSDALRKARASIERESSSLFSIYSTTPKLNLNGKERVSKSEALKILSELTTEVGKDSIDLLASELASQNTFDELQIISDKNLKLLNSAASESALIFSEQVGESRENSYILDLEQNEVGDKAIFNISLFHSGLNSAKVGLKLSLKSEGGLRELAFQPGILLEAGRKKTVTFSLPLDVARENSLNIKLIPENSQNNALVDDDEINFSKSRNSENQIYLIHSGNAENYFGLEGIKNRDFKFLALSELSEETISQASAFIFYKVVPQNIPQKPSLYLLPEASSLFGSEIKKVSAPEISSWDKTHPLTRYLRTKLLNPSTALLLQPPPWASSVITSGSGSLLYVGESADVRLVLSGLELLPYEGKKTASASILFLNILNWLENSDLESKNEFYSLASESNTSQLETLELALEQSKRPETTELGSNLKPLWPKLIFLVLMLLVLELGLRILTKRGREI